MLTEPAAGEQSPAAPTKPTADWGLGGKLEYIENGKARWIGQDGTVYKEGTAAEVEAVFYDPDRILGVEFGQAEKRHEGLGNGTLATELTDILEELKAVVATIAPEERRDFVRNAIDTYMGERAAKTETSGEKETSPKKSRRRTISVSKSFLEARKILDSGTAKILSELYRQGLKIAPPPNAIALIRARKRAGHRLTEKEIRVIRDSSAWDGMPKRSDYPNSGRGKIIREIIGQIMAKQGEGERPDVVASNYINQDWSASDLWDAMWKELKAIHDNANEETDTRNQNRDWSEAEIAASEAQREQQQDDAFDSANDSENGGKAMPVADFSPEWIGVTLQVDGEPMTISAVEMDEEGENAVAITLDDHLRFGRQTLESGETVWAEIDAATDEEGVPLFSGRSNQQPMFDFGATGSMGTRDQMGFDFGRGAAPVKPRLRPLAERIPEIAGEFGEKSDIAAKLAAIAPAIEKIPEDQRADFMTAVDAEAARLRSGVLSAADWQRRSGDYLGERAAMFQRFLDSHTDKTIVGGFAKLMSPPVQQALFSGRADQPGFYSQLSRVIESKMPATATPAQVMQIATGGAKAEEIKWSGLVPWLQGKQKVDKAELLAWMADEGAVRFEEVTHGNNLKEPPVPDYMNTKGFMSEDGLWQKHPEQVPVWDDKGFRVPDEDGELQSAEFKGNNINGDPVWLDRDGFYWTYEEEPEGLFLAGENEPEMEHQSKNNTKFGQHTLPGGENYREVVLAMPESNKRIEGSWAVYDSNGIQRFASSSHDAKEKAEKHAAIHGGTVEKQKDQAENYTSSHFPDIPNYVAHMRLNDRTDANGEPGMFIEENQSDRGQSIRKEINKARSVLDDKWVEVVTRMKKDGILKVVCP